MDAIAHAKVALYGVVGYLNAENDKHAARARSSTDSIIDKLVAALRSQGGQADVRQDGVQRIKEACAQVADRAAQKQSELFNPMRAAMAEEIAKSIRALTLASQAPSEASSGVEQHELEQAFTLIQVRGNAAAYEIAGKMLEKLAAAPPPSASQASCSPPENDGIARAMEVVANMRQSEACLFDAKHSGQRGCDRSDALYDAYVAIRALLSRDGQQGAAE